MPRWLRGVLALRGSPRWMLFLLLAPAEPLLAQAPSGAIAGRILDGKTGAGLEGARILLVNTPLVTASAADGRFVLGGVEPGRYQLQVAAVGYAPDTLSQFNVASGDTARVVVKMHAAPSTSPASSLLRVADQSEWKTPRQVWPSCRATRSFNATSLLSTEPLSTCLG